MRERGRERVHGSNRIMIFEVIIVTIKEELLFFTGLVLRFRPLKSCYYDMLSLQKVHSVFPRYEGICKRPIYGSTTALVPFEGNKEIVYIVKNS